MRAITVVSLVIACVLIVEAQFDYSDEYEPYDYESGESYLPIEEEHSSFGLKEAYIDQCIDHLYKTDPRETCKPTWKHRFWYSKKFQRRGGPIYRSVGGEESEFPRRRPAGQGPGGLSYGLDHNPIRRPRRNLEHPRLKRSFPTTPFSPYPLPFSGRESFTRPSMYSGGLGRCRRNCWRPRWSWRTPLGNNERCVRMCVMSICENEWKSLKRRQYTLSEWGSR